MSFPDVTRIGAYSVLEPIAEGGMSWVFCVADPRFPNARLALKLMKPEFSNDAFLRRFEREARLHREIDHPNLPTIFEYARDEATGLFYYVMTYVDGPSLRQKVASEGRLDLEEAEEIYLPLLGALAELHAHDPPIVHRDLKPSNVLLTRSGVPYLVDLGIARVMEPDEATRTDTFLGSIHYIAPEQARGAEVDARSDVFSAGLCLYHSLTGQRAYDPIPDVDVSVETDVLGYLRYLERTSGEFELRFPNGFPISLREVIKRATRIRPSERYANGTALRAAFRRAILRAMASPAWVPVLPRLAVRPSRRWALSGAVAVVVLLGILLGSPSPSPVSASQLGDLQQLAGGIGNGLSRIDVAADPSVIERFRSSVHTAEVFRSRCELRLGDGGVEAARHLCAEAEGEFQRACENLVSSFLRDRARVETVRIRRRLETLEEIGAPKLVPQEWTQLREQVDRAESLVDADANPDCQVAEQYLEALRTLHGATSILGSMRPTIGRECRRFALAAGRKAAKQRADAERKAAGSTGGVDQTSVFQAALEDSAVALEKAERARGARDWCEAKEQFDVAREAFERTGKIATAVAARARADRKTRSVSTTVARSDLVRLRREMLEAIRLFEDGSYAESERVFAAVSREAMELASRD